MTLSFLCVLKTDTGNPNYKYFMIKIDIRLLTLVSILFAFCIGCQGTQATQGGAIIRVADFGAKGDGKTDDTRAIQAAINAVPARGGELVFDKGTYLISHVLLIRDKTDFSLKGNRSVIRMKAGVPYVRDKSVLSLLTVRKFRMEYLTLDGNRQQRGSVDKETGNSCLILTNVADGYLDQISVKNAPMDGVYINEHDNSAALQVRDLTFRDFRASDNIRQGMTIIVGRNIQIIGGEIRNTRGIGPAAGIDVEPNSVSASSHDIYIKNVAFVNNAGSGVLLSDEKKDSRRVSITDCTFDGNGAGITNMFDEVKISGCTFKNHNNTNPKAIGARAIIDLRGPRVKRIWVTNNRFEQNTGPYFGLYLSSNNKESWIVGNTFSDFSKTVILAYGTGAHIVGNQFSDCAGREVQLLNDGAFDLVAHNQFQGKSTHHVYTARRELYGAGNTTNAAPLTKQHVQAGGEIRAVPPVATSARSTQSQASHLAVVRDQNITINQGTAAVAVHARKPVTLTLPNVANACTITFSRSSGTAPITLSSKGADFESGGKTLVIQGNEASISCFFDGEKWQVFR